MKIAVAGVLFACALPAASLAQSDAPSPPDTRTRPKLVAPKVGEPSKPLVTGTDSEAELFAHNEQGELVTRDDAAGFGRERQWAFSSDASITAQRTTFSEGGSGITSMTLAPAADYFTVKNLSVGGVVGATYSRAGDGKGARFSIGPRVGYNFEVSRLLSVWPKLGLLYAYTGSNEVPLESASGEYTLLSPVKGHAIALSIFVPVMVHPAPHFFAGLGPFYETDLSGDNRATSWGLKLTMGGWLDPFGD